MTKQKETIKCGKEIYKLVEGDTVMDNGACYLFTSRKQIKGWDVFTPRLSQSEFNKFKNNKNVTIDKNHDYGEHVTLYKFKSNN